MIALPCVEINDGKGHAHDVCSHCGNGTSPLHRRRDRAAQAHAAAALYHRYALRDATLTRMMPAKATATEGAMRHEGDAHTQAR